MRSIKRLLEKINCYENMGDMGGGWGSEQSGGSQASGMSSDLPGIEDISDTHDDSAKDDAPSKMESTLAKAIDVGVSAVFGPKGTVGNLAVDAATDSTVGQHIAGGISALAGGIAAALGFGDDAHDAATDGPDAATFEGDTTPDPDNERGPADEELGLVAPIEDETIEDETITLEDDPGLLVGPKKRTLRPDIREQIWNKYKR
jgi:hypothetical protein